MNSSTSLAPLPDEDMMPPPSGCRWRLILMAATLGAVFALGVWVANVGDWSSPKPAFSTSTSSFEKPVVVDISGQIKHPGVYHVPFNSRIYQVIDEAGGALPNADLGALNLADWVEDGSQIVVPAKAPKTPLETHTEPAASSLPPETPKSTFDDTKADPPTKKPTKASSKSHSKSKAKSTFTVTPQKPLDINRANAAKLQLLPGIGPTMASRILQYRKDIQGFTSVDELDEVRGIGPKTLEKIRPLVMVKPLPFQKKELPVDPEKTADSLDIPRD